MKFNVDFGKKLIEYLDPLADISIIEDNWCWKEFGDNFNYLKPKVMKYFEHIKNKDIVFAIYNLVKYCNFNREWAEKIISNCKIGDASYIAFIMVKYCNSDRKWAEEIILRCNIGNPAWSAYLMYENCGSSREWAEDVITRFKNKKSKKAAYMLLICSRSRRIDRR